jgi:hypothetical protein
MIPVEYEPVPARFKVLTWPAASQADLEALAGPENVCAGAADIQVRTGGGTWVTLGSGWAVAVGEDGSRTVLSPGTLAALFQPARS